MPKCASTPRASASSSRWKRPGALPCWPGFGKGLTCCPRWRRSATRRPGWPEPVAEEGPGLPTTLVADLLSRCTLPPDGAALPGAVSGGADSLALLVLAAAAGCVVTAIHVDHGLRAGSEDEAEGGRAAAARFGARFESRRVSLAPGPNLEARARAARFAVLPDDVATGHTMDDQAETILVNLLRGAGADGLARMGPGT